MGWNTGYTIFEATVVGVYDLGKLDKKMLTVLMEPYRNRDIDSGGKKGLVSKDGKEAEQVVIEAWGLDMPTKPPGEYDDDPDAWDAYNEAIYDKFDEVADHFGW